MDENNAEGYQVSDKEKELENTRLQHLARARDPKTFQTMSQVGISAGMHCWEVGAGSGSVAEWMAQQVGKEGRVLCTDIDLRFCRDLPENAEARVHDVAKDPLPDMSDNGFDIIHARAVMQHIPEREEAAQKLMEALKPGGWLILEDADMSGFDTQVLPEPYAKVHHIMATAETTPWRDPFVGSKLFGWLQRGGLVNLDISGDLWIMRPGEDGGEWWLLAVERACEHLVNAELLTEAEQSEVLTQIRQKDFSLVSVLSVSAWGQKPVKT